MDGNTTTSTGNSGVIVAASLSVVSTLGFVGTCLANHKDVIMEKMRCWISWGAPKEEDDIEAQRTVTSPRPVDYQQASFPQISFPIVINNSSGEQRPATVTLPSPFEERPHRHHRSHSDPNPSTSDSEYQHDTTPTSYDGTSSNSSSSADVVHRRISLDEKHSY
ncbi:MAG: hypothetical protein ACO35C_04395 [Pontimonas sp.]